MNPATQRVIASKGDKSAHAQGTAHTFTREEAVRAGKKSARLRLVDNQDLRRAAEQGSARQFS